MANLKKLDYDDWKKIYNQLEVTPSPFDAPFSGTGEHYILVSLLNRFGYNPRSREDAMDLAEELLAMGYERDEEKTV